MEFSAESISMVVGFLLSLLIENLPKFKDWWNSFAYKVLAVSVAGLVVTAALVGLAYAGAPVSEVPIPFIWAGLWFALGVYIKFLIATQAAYLLQASKLSRNQKNGD